MVCKPRSRTSVRRWLAAGVVALVLIQAAMLGSCASSRCAEGLRAEGNRCVDNCGDCGERAFCDTSSNECRCSPGYAGEPCVFDAINGLVKDPDFQGLEVPGMTERYWVGDGNTGATVLSALPFSNLPEFAGDTGVGLIPARAICAGESLKQVLVMPDLEQTNEPLVAEIVYQARNVHGLAIGFDRSWTRLRPTEEQPEGAGGTGGEGAGGTGGDGADCSLPKNSNCEVGRETICLGEGAYGRAPTEESPTSDEIVVRIGVSEPGADCWPGNEPAGTILIRRFWIRPAETGECENQATGAPIAFGEVLNGEANPADGGWRFETGTDVKGALEARVGSDGSPGARLARSAGNSAPGAMITKMSVPLPSQSIPSLALRFRWRGTRNQRFRVNMGTWVDHGSPGRQVDTLVGDGSELSHVYCLPPWTHGSVVDLSFSLADSAPFETAELVVDEVEIIDSDCGDNPNLLDPTFDSDNNWFGTTLRSRLQLVTTQNFGAPPLNGAENRFLALRNGDTALDMSIETYVMVPESDEVGGPAVFFQATSPTESVLRLSRGQGELLDASAQTNSTWQELQGCLPASWAGRWYRFDVNLPADLLAVEADVAADVFVDDFRLDTSELCRTD